MSYLRGRLSQDIPTKRVKRHLSARHTLLLLASFLMRNLPLPPPKSCGQSHHVFTITLHVLNVHRLSTGIRALDHAVENLCQPFEIPPLKHLCYGAIVDLFKYLPQSKADPYDIHARQKLQVASWMSLWPSKQGYR
jgi:Iron-containing alcohol dehydrogenase